MVNPREVTVVKHYIGLDWAQRNMAIARLTDKADKEVIDIPSDIDDLKLYLSELKGHKTLTFEESNPAQWLYTELRDSVDEIVVCDPYRNHLLKEGRKTDKTDALKLAKLLKAKMLKPIFHGTDEHIELRKLVSGYDDLIQSGVRLKNQRLALFRARGNQELKTDSELFVAGSLEARIEHYELEKSLFKEELSGLRKKFKQIRLLESVPGIGLIGAVTILSIVVDPHRFPDARNYISYCGLVKHDKMSGGRSYGKRTPRHSRRLKYIYKVAAMACVNASEKNSMNQYYNQLIKERSYPEYRARHNVARRIATLTYGVFKTGKAYKVENELK